MLILKNQTKETSAKGYSALVSNEHYLSNHASSLYITGMEKQLHKIELN